MVLSSRRWALMPLSVIAVLSIAACSDDDGAIGDSEPPTEQQREAYEQCLVDAGYAPEDFTPVSMSITTDLEAVLADSRCIVASGVGEVDVDDPEEATAHTERTLTFMRCMRAAGWQVPDPEPSANGKYLVPAGLPIPDDAEEAKAFHGDLETCSADAGLGGVEGETP